MTPQGISHEKLFEMIGRQQVEIATIRGLLQQQTRELMDARQQLAILGGAAEARANGESVGNEIA